ILVDNGLIKLTVIEKKKNRVLCKVITPSTLGSRRHINLPGVHVSLPALTKKDIADVTLGAQLGVDFVALSFVREPGDLTELRDLLTRKKSKAQVLAKIEDQAAVESIDDIIKIADLVMVARGDLGIEVPMEELPIIQRRIVKSCIRLGKPVVVATHLLESMITNRIPTRAEITDVANAVFEQADAIMLSGETSIGHYPVECVEVLNRVAARTERSGGAGYAESAILEDARQKTVASAVVLANSLVRSKIIVFTRHGRMARNTSNLRPERAIIFAFTPSEVEGSGNNSEGKQIEMPILSAIRTDSPHGERYASTGSSTSIGFSFLLNARRSFESAMFCSCRMRSRVTPNFFPTSSRVF